jgi:uncharacterized membrane protein YkoI
MRAKSMVLVAALAFVLPSGSALAGPRCLSKDQQRAMIANGKVVRLSVAVRAARRLGGDVVRARLCQRDQGLAYMLTVLRRDGKVRVVAVDARSGVIVGGG